MRKILRLCKYSTFPGKQLFYYKYIRQFNQVFYQRRKKIDLDLCVRTGGGKPSENRGANVSRTYSALLKRCSAVFYVHPTGSPHKQMRDFVVFAATELGAEAIRTHALNTSLTYCFGVFVRFTHSQVPRQIQIYCPFSLYTSKDFSIFSSISEY